MHHSAVTLSGIIRYNQCGFSCRLAPAPGLPSCVMIRTTQWHANCLLHRHQITEVLHWDCSLPTQPGLLQVRAFVFGRPRTTAGHWTDEKGGGNVNTYPSRKDHEGSL